MEPPETLDQVLEQAARLQEVVPGAVLVGGSAAALHAGHRLSFDDDHVVADLVDRFDTVLDHLEALDDWSTARASHGKIVLGALGGIETGIRQMRRRPLETEEVTRNQTRDYLDIAALSDLLGIDAAARALVGMDDYYAEVNEGPDAVATQVARQLAAPRPRDEQVTRQLDRYKRLDPRWHDWATVVAVCASVAAGMLR